MTIGVGLIGYGKAGRTFHEPLIRSVDGLELRTIARRGDVDAMLSDPIIALAVIATPNDTHFELGRRALLAGKHVVVDKPFTVTSAEATTLIELARERDRVLTVFHNRRWDGDFLTVRRLLDQKALGRLVSFESRHDRFRNAPKPGAWKEEARPGSGVFYDLGIHLIDQALVLFGAPQRVTADIRTERDFGASDDAFDIVMHYPRLRVALGAGMLVRDRTPRFVLRGTNATFVKYGLDPQESILAHAPAADESATLITDRGEEKIEILPGSYATFYENVRDAIASGAELAVKPEEARAAVEILEVGMLGS